MGLIVEIVVRKILDSRGNPTSEVEIFTEYGYGSAGAPSGASTGIHEVCAVPEGGVDASLAAFEEKAVTQLVGMDVMDQTGFDMMLHEIDGTDNFSSLGGNLAVALSLACAKASAAELAIPLYRYLAGLSRCSIPYPMGNVLGGGRHAVGGTDIQEFMAVTQTHDPTISVFANATVHKRVGKKLKERFPNVSLGKGDEGAWVAPITNEGALEVVAEACVEVSAEVGVRIQPALDLAASEFYKDNMYVYKDKKLSPGEQVDYMVSLIKDYDLVSVEDPFDQDDFESYVELTKKIGNECIIVGDDLYVTNAARIKKGIDMGAGNAVLIKPNQIGTLTDTIEAIEYSHKNMFKTVVSHRSGETTDETIAHIATAFGSYGIKTGTVGGERIAKLNELIRIHEDLLEE